MGLFDDIPEYQVDAFFEDLKMVLRLVAELDKEYGEVAEEIYQNEPRFDEILGMFNEKYSGIRIKKGKSTESFFIRIYLLDTSLAEIFKDAASKISGLRSMGYTSPNEFSASSPEDVTRFLEGLGNSLQFTYDNYDDPEVHLTYDEQEKEVRFMNTPAYEIEKNCPGFFICSYYALRKGFKKEIDILVKEREFCYLSFGIADAQKDPGFFN